MYPEQFREPRAERGTLWFRYLLFESSWVVVMGSEISAPCRQLRQASSLTHTVIHKINVSKIVNNFPVRQKVKSHHISHRKKTDESTSRNRQTSKQRWKASHSNKSAVFPLFCNHTVSTSFLWDWVQVDDLCLGGIPSPVWQAPRNNVNKHSTIRTWQSSL